MSGLPPRSKKIKPGFDNTTSVLPSLSQSRDESNPRLLNRCSTPLNNRTHFNNEVVKDIAYTRSHSSCSMREQELSRPSTRQQQHHLPSMVRRPNSHTVTSGTRAATPSRGPLQAPLRASTASARAGDLPPLASTIVKSPREAALSNALKILSDESSEEKDLSLLSLGDGQFTIFFKQLATKKNCVALNLTGATMSRASAMELWAALSENPTPVQEVILTDSSVLAYEDIAASIQAKCIQNGYFVEEREEKKKERRLAAFRREQHEELVRVGKHLLDQKKSTWERVKKMEFKDYRRLQLSFRFARKHAQIIDVARLYDQGVSDINDEMTAEEEVGRVKVVRLCNQTMLNLINKEYTCIRELILGDEHAKRKRYWTQYCEDWNVTTSEVKRRFRGYKLDLLQQQKEQSAARSEILKERWKEFQEICKDLAGFEDRQQRLAYEQRLRLEEEVRKKRQKVLEEAVLAERTRERLKHEQARREANVAQYVAQAARESNRVRHCVEEAEAIAFNSLRCINKLHEKLASKHRKFGDVHRMYTKALKELPRLRMHVPSVADPSIIYKGAFKPTPLEPNLCFNLGMDVLWPIRAMVLRKELERLLPQTKVAKKDAVPSMGPYVAEAAQAYENAFGPDALAWALGNREGGKRASPTGKQPKRFSTSNVWSPMSRSGVGSADGRAALEVERPNWCAPLRKYFAEPHPLEIAECDMQPKVEDIQKMKEYITRGTIVVELDTKMRPGLGTLQYYGAWECDPDANEQTVAAGATAGSPGWLMLATSLCLSEEDLLLGDSPRSSDLMDGLRLSPDCSLNASLRSPKRGLCSPVHLAAAETKTPPPEKCTTKLTISIPLGATSDMIQDELRKVCFVNGEEEEHDGRDEEAIRSASAEVDLANTTFTSTVDNNAGQKRFDKLLVNVSFEIDIFKWRHYIWRDGHTRLKHVPFCHTLKDTFQLCVMLAPKLVSLPSRVIRVRHDARQRAGLLFKDIVTQEPLPVRRTGTNYLELTPLTAAEVMQQETTVFSALRGGEFEIRLVDCSPTEDFVQLIDECVDEEDLVPDTGEASTNQAGGGPSKRFAPGPDAMEMTMGSRGLYLNGGQVMIGRREVAVLTTRVGAVNIKLSNNTTVNASDVLRILRRIGYVNGNPADPTPGVRTLHMKGRNKRGLEVKAVIKVDVYASDEPTDWRIPSNEVVYRGLLEAKVPSELVPHCTPNTLHFASAIEIIDDDTTFFSRGHLKARIASDTSQHMLEGLFLDIPSKPSRVGFYFVEDESTVRDIPVRPPSWSEDEEEEGGLARDSSEEVTTADGQPSLALDAPSPPKKPRSSRVVTMAGIDETEELTSPSASVKFKSVMSNSGNGSEVFSSLRRQSTMRAVSSYLKIADDEAGAGFLMDVQLFYDGYDVATVTLECTGYRSRTGHRLCRGIDVNFSNEGTATMDAVQDLVKVLAFAQRQCMVYREEIVPVDLVLLIGWTTGRKDIHGDPLPDTNENVPLRTTMNILVKPSMLAMVGNGGGGGGGPSKGSPMAGPKAESMDKYHKDYPENSGWCFPFKDTDDLPQGFFGGYIKAEVIDGRDEFDGLQLWTKGLAAQENALGGEVTKSEDPDTLHKKGSKLSGGGKGNLVIEVYPAKGNALTHLHFGEDSEKRRKNMNIEKPKGMHVPESNAPQQPLRSEERSEDPLHTNEPLVNFGTSEISGSQGAEEPDSLKKTNLLSMLHHAKSAKKKSVHSFGQSSVLSGSMVGSTNSDAMMASSGVREDKWIQRSRRISLARKDNFLQLADRSAAKLVNSRNLHLVDCGLAADYINPFVTSYTVQADSKTVARMYVHPKAQFTLVFEPKVFVSPALASAIFKHIGYRNTSRNPHILEKTLSLSVVSHQHGTSATLRRVVIDAYDDPTEIFMKHTKHVWRTGASGFEPIAKPVILGVKKKSPQFTIGKGGPPREAITPLMPPGERFVVPRGQGRLDKLRLFPAESTMIEDPDTDFWDGGSITVAGVVGGEPTDRLVFLTLEEQKIVADLAKDPTNLFIEVEGPSKPGGKMRLHYVDGGGGTLMNDVATISFIPFRPTPPDPQVPAEEAAASTLVPGKPCRMVIHFAAQPTIFQRKISISHISRVIYAICFTSNAIPPETIEKVFELRIKDYDNAVPGVQRVQVDHMPPPLSPHPEASSPLQYSMRLALEGKPEFLLLGCSVGFPAREKFNNGSIEVFPLAGFHQRDVLMMRFYGTSFITTQDGMIIANKEMVCKATVMLNHHIKLDFNKDCKGATGRRVSQLLQCLAFLVEIKDAKERDGCSLADRVIGITVNEHLKDSFDRPEGFTLPITVGFPEAGEKS